MIRSNLEIVTENIQRIFDPLRTGVIGFNELLLAFSMSMRGSGVVIKLFDPLVSLGSISLNLHVNVRIRNDN